MLQTFLSLYHHEFSSIFHLESKEIIYSSLISILIISNVIKTFVLFRLLLLRPTIQSIIIVLLTGDLF